jgi:hypothetical protein
MKILLLIAAYLSIVTAKSTKEFEGFKVVQFNFTQPEHVERAHLLFGDEADYWVGPSLRFPTEILLSPELSRIAIDTFAKLGVKHRIINQNVQRSIDMIELEHSQHRSRRSGASLSERVVGTFPSFNDMNAWLDQMGQDYSNLVTVENIGTTFEGRTMKLIKIGDKSVTNKLKVFMEAGIHAREWLAPATIIYIIDKFLKNFNSDSAIKAALKKVEWNFVTSGNPDGYEYSRTSYRMWRKTRSRYSITQTCYGVDPNRNWDYKWGGDGTSSNQCSDIYKGPRAFSEVETQVLSDAMRRVQPKVYIAVHTYVPVFIYPYAYKAGQIIVPPNAAAHRELARKVTEAINAVNDLDIGYGNTVEMLSEGAGGSDDWAVGSGTSEFAYTIELRAGCAGGFLACVSDIVPSGEEILAGFLELSRNI